MFEHHALWSIVPPVPGRWHELALADSCALIAHFTACEARFGAKEFTAERVAFERARILALQCAPGWLLADIEAKMQDGCIGSLNFLMGPGMRLVPIDWNRLTVIEALQGSLVEGPSEKQLKEYILLCCNLVRNDSWRFILAEHPDDLSVAPEANAAEIKVFRNALTPITFGEDEHGLVGQATMVYFGQVSRVAFRLSPSGFVDLTSDEALAPAPVCAEEFRGLFRIVHPRLCLRK